MAMLMSRKAAISLTLMVVAGPSCAETSDEPPPVLVVQAGREQPIEDRLGVIVVIQSRGGNWLEVEVTGGSLTDGADGVCLRAPRAPSLRESRQDLLVIPEQVQAVVTVRLFDGTPLSDEEGDSGSGPGGASSNDAMLRGPAALGPCRIDARALREVIEPVQRVSMEPSPPTDGGSSGMGGVGATASAPEAGASPGGAGGAAGSRAGGEGGTSEEPDADAAGSGVDGGAAVGGTE